jgi:hypothetical protein
MGNYGNGLRKIDSYALARSHHSKALPPGKLLQLANLHCNGYGAQSMTFSFERFSLRFAFGAAALYPSRRE